MPPDGLKMLPRPLLVALGPFLGLLRAILGRRETIWGASTGDLATTFPSWRELGVSGGDLRASLGDLGAILGAPEGLEQLGGGEGAAVVVRSVAPPRDFLRKFLLSRDLKNKRKQEMFTMGLQHAVLRWGRRI